MRIQSVYCSVCARYRDAYRVEVTSASLSPKADHRCYYKLLPSHQNSAWNLSDKINLPILCTESHERIAYWCSRALSERIHADFELRGANLLTARGEKSTCRPQNILQN